MHKRYNIVTVVGGGQDINIEPAYEVGRLLAESGLVLLTGAEGGIMKAASKGAFEHGGLVMGILPGESEKDSPPNPYVHLPIYTGINEARNVVNILSGHCVIAHPGGPGTEQEMTIAKTREKPLITIGWKKEDLPLSLRDYAIPAKSPEEAVQIAINFINDMTNPQQIKNIFTDKSLTSPADAPSTQEPKVT